MGMKCDICGHVIEASPDLLEDHCRDIAFDLVLEGWRLGKGRSPTTEDIDRCRNLFGAALDIAIRKHS